MQLKMPFLTTDEPSPVPSRVPESPSPTTWEGLDETVHAVAMIGHHAMFGTANGFLDHTQTPKERC